VLTIPAALRPAARRLARANLFAPMYYGTGVKRASAPQGDATD
jgi:hypothetical protein